MRESVSTTPTSRCQHLLLYLRHIGIGSVSDRCWCVRTHHRVICCKQCHAHNHMHSHSTNTFKIPYLLTTSCVVALGEALPPIMLHAKADEGRGKAAALSRVVAALTRRMTVCEISLFKYLKYFIGAPNSNHHIRQGTGVTATQPFFGSRTLGELCWTLYGHRCPCYEVTDNHGLTPSWSQEALPFDTRPMASETGCR